jgi:hypothetical protein
LYAETLHFLAQHRWLWEVATTGLSYFTLIFEIGFAFLIWNRTLRGPIITAAACLHLGIALCMGLVTFSLMMMVLVLSFVPAEAIHGLLRRLVPAAETTPQVRLEMKSA